MSSFSRKLMLSGAMVCAACTAMLGTGPAARAADDLPYVYIPPVDVDVNVDLGPHRPPRIYDPRGLYAGIPPGAHYEREIDRPLVAPDQVAAMLRSTGFSLLGPINRRGWVYTAAVLNPRGDDGRVIIDARTGAIIRFIPAFAINGRTDQELSTLYGPPGLPPGPPPIAQDMRRAPRPPLNVPKVASRTPPSVPLSRSPPSAKTGPAPAPVAVAPSKPQVAAVPEAAKPVEATRRLASGC
ncbi:MAG: hypothetical protein K2X60_07385 [Xanthobacteraceae bacterium]|nr:hypothetical protein [Xanthobacteraceae bacterium]